MASTFTTRRIIEFAETDMAGIVHFSNFFRYMEATEHEFFRSQGLVLHEDTSEGMIGWARVHAECDYRFPLKYLDEVEIQLFVEEKTGRSLSYRFRFWKDDQGPVLCAEGQLRVVCIVRPPNEQKIRARQIPEDIAARIEVASGKPWEL